MKQEAKIQVEESNKTFEDYAKAVRSVYDPEKPAFNATSHVQKIVEQRRLL